MKDIKKLSRSRVEQGIHIEVGKVFLFETYVFSS